MESGYEEENKLRPIETTKTYTYDGERGWRRYRIFRPGWGMYHDIKRRLPYYWSDITDALTYRTFASTVRMYFVKYVSAPTSKGSRLTVKVSSQPSHSHST
jgi:hypothetical protein